jgi:CRP-like cAMP-binding protein
MEHLSDILNLDDKAEHKKVKKGELLQSKGEFTSKSFYVEKGLLRSYTIDEKGKEHTFMFACEGWVTADIESQEFHQSAELYIECLEDSEIVAFNRKCFIISNLSNKQLRENAHLMARRIAVLQKRVLMLMSASAKERYQHFLEAYPDLLHRIPQRMIASYLGITPEALSKIRGEMTRSL